MWDLTSLTRDEPTTPPLDARGEGERVLALESREGTRASRRVDNQVKGNGCQEVRMVFITGERSLRCGRAMRDL